MIRTIQILRALFAASLFFASTAAGETILQHNSGIVEGVDWQQVGENHIQIMRSNTNRFVFEARDGGSLGSIGVIWYSGSSSGGFIKVSIASTVAGGSTHPGAVDVEQVDLSAFSVGPSEIAGVWITGTFGVSANPLSFADKLTDEFEVLGDLRGDLLIGTGGSSAAVVIGGNVDGFLAVTGAMTGDVTVDGVLLGSGIGDGIGAYSLSANIAVNGFGTNNGGIFITDPSPAIGEMSGTVRIGNFGRVNGDLIFEKVTGAVTVHRDLAGSIEVTDSLSGSINITRDVLDRDNHIWIHHMNGGAISCRNMHLRSPGGGEWLTLGAFAFDETLVQSGTIDVSGTLTGRIYCRTISDLDITIARLEALDDDNGGLAGIMSGVGWLPTSSITVTGDFVRGSIHYADNVVASTRNLDCHITITGDMGSPTTTARITTATLIGGKAGNLDINGMIQIGGDLTSGALIKAEGDLNGVLDVAGDFGGHMECVNLNADLFIGNNFNDAGAGDEVEITGSVAAGVDIHVNHHLNIDGRWQAIATMKIGAVVHDNTWDAINDPSVTPDVWVVSEYRGDCNNDNLITSFDIEPFLDVLFDQPKYLSEHPGLFSADLTAQELMIYHGDSNCDGVVDAFDIEAFTSKLFANPRCTGRWCGSDPGQCCGPIGCNGPNCALLFSGTASFVGQLNLILSAAYLIANEAAQTGDQAARISALFLDHVDSRYYPRLIETCQELIDHYRNIGDFQRCEMWIEVLIALSAG